MDDKKVFDITEVVDNVIGVENININKCMFDRKNIFIHIGLHMPSRFNIKIGSFFPVSHTLRKVGATKSDKFS